MAAGQIPGTENHVFNNRLKKSRSYTENRLELLAFDQSPNTKKRETERSKMNLDIIVYGDITLLQCLYSLGVLVAVYMVLKLLKKLFFNRSEPMKHSIPVVCSSCGWQGRIGQFAAHCPKCGQSVE